MKISITLPGGVAPTLATSPRMRPSTSVTSEGGGWLWLPAPAWRMPAPPLAVIELARMRFPTVAAPETSTPSPVLPEIVFGERIPGAAGSSGGDWRPPTRLSCAPSRKCRPAPALPAFVPEPRPTRLLPNSLPEEPAPRTRIPSPPERTTVLPARRAGPPTRLPAESWMRMPCPRAPKLVEETSRSPTSTPSTRCPPPPARTMPAVSSSPATPPRVTCTRCAGSRPPRRCPWPSRTKTTPRTPLSNQEARSQLFSPPSR